MTYFCGRWPWVVWCAACNEEVQKLKTPYDHKNWPSWFILANAGCGDLVSWKLEWWDARANGRLNKLLHFGQSMQQWPSLLAGLISCKMGSGDLLSWQWQLVGERCMHWCSLTLLHSERPKLYAILAFLSAKGLKRIIVNTYVPEYWTRAPYWPK